MKDKLFGLVMIILLIFYCVIWYNIGKNQGLKVNNGEYCQIQRMEGRMQNNEQKTPYHSGDTICFRNTKGKRTLLIQ